MISLSDVFKLNRLHRMRPLDGTFNTNHIFLNFINLIIRSNHFHTYNTMHFQHRVMYLPYGMKYWRELYLADSLFLVSPQDLPDFNFAESQCVRGMSVAEFNLAVLSYNRQSAISRHMVCDGIFKSFCRIPANTT